MNSQNITQKTTYSAVRFFGATSIVHGWSDDVIPSGHSIRFAEEADCTLHLDREDHRLTGAIEVVEGLFRQFLNRVSPGSM